MHRFETEWLASVGHFTAHAELPWNGIERNRHRMKFSEVGQRRENTCFNLRMGAVIRQEVEFCMAFMCLCTASI